MMSNLRVWNWIPKNKNDIKIYCNSFDSNYYEKILYFHELNLYIRLIMDEKILVNLSEKNIGHRFTSLDPVKDRTLTLYFLSETLPVRHEMISIEGCILSKEKERTDVLFDPIFNVALIHAPSKFGFINSMILGLMSFFMIKEKKYGLHSGLTISGDKGYIFCGAHGMGKTTLTLTHLLLNKKTNMLSDDWVFYSKNNQNNIVTAQSTDQKIFVSIDTVKNILEAVPIEHINNKRLYKKSLLSKIDSG